MALYHSVRCVRTYVTTKEELASLATYKNGLGRPLENRTWSAECVDCWSHAQNPNPGQRLMWGKIYPVQKVGMPEEWFPKQCLSWTKDQWPGFYSWNLYLFLWEGTFRIDISRACAFQVYSAQAVQVSSRRKDHYSRNPCGHDFLESQGWWVLMHSGQVCLNSLSKTILTTAKGRAFLGHVNKGGSLPYWTADDADSVLFFGDASTKQN